MFCISHLRVSGNILQRKVALKNVTVIKQIIKTIQPPRRLATSTGIRSRSFQGEKFIQKDRIPNGYQIIYRSPMQIYFSIAHHITTVSALVVGGLAVYIAIYGIEALHAPLFEEGGLVSDKDDLKWFAIGFVLINLGMRYIVMRYPLRIYRNEKQYIAVLDGQLPLTKRKIEFQQGEVEAIKPFGIMPWRESWFKVKNESLLLLVDYFKTPSELFRMMISEQP